MLFPSCRVLQLLLHRPLRVAVVPPDARQQYILTSLGHTITLTTPDLIITTFDQVSDQLNNHLALLVTVASLHSLPPALFTLEYTIDGFRIVYLSQHTNPTDLGIKLRRFTSLPVPLPIVPQIGVTWADVYTWGLCLQEQYRTIYLGTVLRHGRHCIERAVCDSYPGMLELVGPTTKSQYQEIRPTTPHKFSVHHMPGSSTLRRSGDTLGVSHDCVLSSLTDQELVRLFYAGYDVSHKLFAALVPAMLFALCWRSKYPEVVCLQDVNAPLLKIPAVMPGNHASRAGMLSLIVTNDIGQLNAWMQYVKDLEFSNPGTRITTLVVGNIRQYGDRLPEYKWSDVPVHVIGNPHMDILGTLEDARNSPVYNARSVVELYTYTERIDPIRKVRAASKHKLTLPRFMM